MVFRDMCKYIENHTLPTPFYKYSLQNYDFESSYTEVTWRGQWRTVHKIPYINININIMHININIEIDF